MSTSLDQLRQAIDELRTLDVDSLTGQELHELAIGLVGARDQLAAVTAPVLDRWQHAGYWALDGSKSAATRLARDTHSARRTAQFELRRARSLASMPATSAAATAGELSLDHVALLAAANTSERRDLFAEHEQHLIDTIRPLRHHAARRTVDYWAKRADAALGIDDTANHQQQASSLHASTTLDGMVVLDGTLDPVGGAIVVNELDRLVDQLRLAELHQHDAEGDGIERTPAQRRAAALVEMAQRSATMPADGRRPKPLFTVLLGARSFEHLCELANGTVITPEHLVPYMNAAMLETILFDGPTAVVSVSKQRTFTGALRRAIEVRDRHCQHPSGCDVPADQCDVDHIIPHSRGGPTSQSNGRIQCPTHNRDKTKHDHDAIPRPERTVTRLDELRARLRWRTHQHYPDEMREVARAS